MKQYNYVEYSELLIIISVKDSRWTYTEEARHQILAGTDASPTRFDPASVMHYSDSVRLL